ncbi:Ribonuclease Z [compost metagenome]
MYGKLKRGESINLPDGSLLHSTDVLGNSKPGRIVTILGDTRPCEAAVQLAQDADVLVHESTFLHELAETAYTYHHSTARQAAEAAKRAGAKQLFLTHFSSRYKYNDQLQQLEREAREVFPHSDLAKEHVMYPILRHG